MVWLESALSLLTLLMLAPVIIFFIQVLMALTVHRPQPQLPSRRPAACLLIPAHNEAEVIVHTLRTILPQLSKLDRLLVVADNCSDETAVIAREMGAEVIERTCVAQRGKGYALDFGIRHIAKDPREVVIVIDADCTVHSGAIDWLARICGKTGRPVQGLDLMLARPGAGLKARIAEFAWVVKNHVRPLGYRRLGLPCQLMGTGMALPWVLLAKARLGNAHLVEDMKLGIDLTLAGYPPVFCPEAKVSSFFPVGRVAEVTQRTRWEHGHLGIILQEFPRVFGRAICNGDARLLGVALDLSVPPVALLLMLLTAVFMIALAAAGMGLSSQPLALSSVALVLLTTAVAAAWYGWARRIVSFGDLLSIPLYVLAKVPLYLKFFTRRQKAWVKTDRE